MRLGVPSASPVTAMLYEDFRGELELDHLIGADDVDDNVRLRGAPLGPDGTPLPLPKNWRRSVCRHWLRGLCKKGDECEYLHIYDPSRMPVCHFYATHGECNDKDCIFAHRQTESGAESCPHYARGFCRHGTSCRQKHVFREPCPLYLQGFCPDGPECPYGHPKFELPEFNDEHGARGPPPPPETVRRTRPRAPHARAAPRHHPAPPLAPSAPALAPQIPGRSLDHVTCYRCWRRGHYATSCTSRRIPQPPPALLGR